MQEKKVVAVDQFDGTVKRLKIDLTTGVRQVIPSNEVKESHVAFGMFETEKLEPEIESVALLATPDGPLLLLKDTQFRPEIKDTKIQIKDEDRLSHFLLFSKGKPIFGLFYEQKAGIGLHPYLREREDFDFYYWLSKNITNPKLYQTYTREIRYIDAKE